MERDQHLVLGVTDLSPENGMRPWPCVPASHRDGVERAWRHLPADDQKKLHPAWQDKDIMPATGRGVIRAC